MSNQKAASKFQLLYNTACNSWSKPHPNLQVSAYPIVNHASPACVDITCRQALMDLKPCEGYVKGSGLGTPPISCCHGLKTVLTAAKGSECQLSKCFKKTIAGLHLRLDRIMQLPVSPPITLDLKINSESIPQV